VIYVDSSFWIAEAMPRDGRYADAIRLASARGSEPATTSNLVVGETWTFLRRRTGYAYAMRWLDTIQVSDDLAVARIDANLEAEAWAWLRVHDERPYSFVDATSFALMRKLRIADALAFDGDFAAAGFNELRPSA
jgi:predicted nucleic acid-binding protein